MGRRWMTAGVAVGMLAWSTACGSKKAPVVPPPAPRPAPAQVAAAPPPAPPSRTPVPAPTPPAPLSDAERFARMSLDALNAAGPLADVFFAYDQAVLTEADRAALQKDADWLTKWPSTRIRIEGHADERGTPEYNLALGERRAQAARSYLVSLGIQVDRIAVVSEGKEAPFCREHAESCWSQNRRGHVLLTAK